MSLKPNGDSSGAAAGAWPWETDAISFTNENRGTSGADGSRPSSLSAAAIRRRAALVAATDFASYSSGSQYGLTHPSFTQRKSSSIREK